MKTYFSPLLAMALLCMASGVSHSALVEQAKTNPKDLIALARRIQQSPFSRQIIITHEHEQELKRVATKHTPKFKKTARLFGFIEFFNSNTVRNPVCIPEIRKNIIEFLGVPLSETPITDRPTLNFIECPDQHDSNSTWHKNREFLVATKPTALGEGSIFIYSRDTGKLLYCEQNKAEWMYLPGNDGISRGPVIKFGHAPLSLSAQKRPVLWPTVIAQECNGENRYLTFKCKSGILSQKLHAGRTVFYNAGKQVHDLDSMSIPQAIALNTVDGLASHGRSLKGQEPLVNVLNEKQKSEIIKSTGIKIQTPQELSSRKRKA